jgi:hypothetical protein
MLVPIVLIKLPSGALFRNQWQLATNVNIFNLKRKVFVAQSMKFIKNISFQNLKNKMAVKISN